MKLEKMVITGGYTLEGDTYVSGGKNSTVALIPAILLSDAPCTVENLPDIEDVRAIRDILMAIGAKVDYVPGKSITVDPRGVDTYQVPAELSARLRAGYYFWGALLGRCGRVQAGYPGGCAIGARPFDQHIKGFEALGAKVTEENASFNAHADKLKGNSVVFDVVTVGGTINVMLAAAKAEGTTVIYNAAKEPHIVDLANFLNAMGAKVRGAGTSQIRITGQQHLHSCTYSAIPDQIETGTLMIAAAATHGDVTIYGCIPTHMDSLTAKLLEMGVQVTEGDDRIRVCATGAQRGVNLKTQVYPGFPTDLQQPMSALLTTAQGQSVVRETIYSQRFNHLMEMSRMGARVIINGDTALIEGVPALYGASVRATDLRAGAALVVAGLMANGTTEIMEPWHIDRGYEKLEDKLRALGANICREPLL